MLKAKDEEITKLKELLKAKDEAIKRSLTSSKLLRYLADGHCQCDPDVGNCPCIKCDAQRVVEWLEQALKGGDL